MALPITVPYTFGNATTAIPLSNLDSDYATVYQAVNGIGNGSVALANVAITGGTISGNTTASNVTVSSGTFTNVTLSNVTISSVSTPITAAEGGTGSSSAFTTNGVVYASSTSALATGSALVFDGSNLGLGVTPSAWNLGKAIEVGAIGNAIWGVQGSDLRLAANMYYNTGYKYAATGTAARYDVNNGSNGGHAWYTAPSGTAGNAITFTQAMTLDSSGNLLVGTTSPVTGGKISAIVSGQQAASFRSDASTVVTILNLWGNETSGNQIFARFATDSNAERGTISYNRGAGLVAYNVTSDYRAKDIIGPVTDSGALIDSVPVYIGKMKGATQDRPMFIAHETPNYAHTGEKDAVDKDGKPVYQQMDASALIPVMWAEIQSLRKRILTLENK